MNVPVILKVKPNNKKYKKNKYRYSDIKNYCTTGCQLNPPPFLRDTALQASEGKTCHRQLFYSFSSLSVGKKGEPFPTPLFCEERGDLSSPKVGVSWN